MVNSETTAAEVRVGLTFVRSRINRALEHALRNHPSYFSLEEGEVALLQESLKTLDKVEALLDQLKITLDNPSHPR